MATILNPSDTSLQATTPRLITVALANNLLFGGDVTGTVNGISAASITSSINNFNTSNDQNSAAIVAPVAINPPTHVNNADGSVNLTLSWTWSGTEADIDGFILLSIGRTSSGAYTIGTDTANETAYVLPANKRSQILYGVAADRWYTFGVRAYRRVSTNINANGIIASNISQTPTGFQPSSSVAITVGTINGTGISGYQNSNIVLNADGAAGTISLTGGGTSQSLTGIINPSRPINTSNVATYISAGAISADRITVNSLSALSANLGTITAGTLSAVTINSSTINSGTLNAGNFTSYAWPGTTGSGGHLSSQGLLVGNPNNTTLGRGALEFNANTGYFFVGRGGGQYIQLGTDGTFTVNGRIVATANIQTNAVTVPRTNSGTFASAWGPGIVVPCIADSPILIWASWALGGTDYDRQIRYAPDGYYGLNVVFQQNAPQVQQGNTVVGYGSGKSYYTISEPVYVPGPLSVATSFTPNWTGQCYLTLVGIGNPPAGWIAAMQARDQRP